MRRRRGVFGLFLTAASISEASCNCAGSLESGPDAYVHCNLSQPSKPFAHFWEHTVGSGHAPLALRADWQAQLRRCHEELGFQHVRFHALLSDEMGMLVLRDEARTSIRFSTRIR